MSVQSFYIYNTNYMESKHVMKFKVPKQWPLNDRVVTISKIESVTHTYLPVDEVEGKENLRILRNVIKNTALMANAHFANNGDDIKAIISEVVGTTLIKTQWNVPKTIFNSVVTILMIDNNIPDSKFFITE